MNKKIIFPKFAAILIAFTFAACSDDEIKMPEINNLEVGYDNDKTAFQGGELHMDAEIIAEGKIDRVIAEIHFEGEHHHDKINEDDDHNHDHTEAWEVIVEYTEFSGQKNALFHKHIDVPANAELGKYHLHLKVIDLEGNTVYKEVECEVKEANHDHGH